MTVKNVLSMFAMTSSFVIYEKALQHSLQRWAMTPPAIPLGHRGAARMRQWVIK
jgi:hypothetical protein